MRSHSFPGGEPPRPTAPVSRGAAAETEQYATEIDLGIPIDVGAPLPHLLVAGHRSVVIFHTGLPADPTWDGSSVTVIDPKSDQARSIGWVMFEGVYHASLGPPNDEALAGHPLYGHGLNYYAAHDVTNSALTAQLEKRNRVHRYHRPERFAALRHLVITFHDETLECVCSSWTSGQFEADFESALAQAATALRTGSMK